MRQQIVGCALIFAAVMLLVSFSQASTFTPAAVTDQTPTAPLANPAPASFQPRYVSGFGLDNTFTVFFEDRDAGQMISYCSTTTGPTGFPASAVGTSVIPETHFCVKDWPINVGGTDYAYRAWGSVGNNLQHTFYVSNDLINWVLVSTFTIPNHASFTGARGWVYYGFHDVILINGTYYAFAESNQGQTMLVRSTNGDDVWEAFASVGGTQPTDGPLQMPESPTPSGSFVDLGYDRGYGKVQVRGNDSGCYLAINTAARLNLPPADLEAAFINPANWTWNDGSTGLPTGSATPLLVADAERDIRECWVVPNSDPDDDWVIIYDADYGIADGGKALGYATLTPPPPPPVHNITQGTNHNTIQEAIDEADPGDVIECDPGTYEEQVVCTVDDLTLRGSGSGSDPASNTIVRSPTTLTYYFDSGGNLNRPIIGIDGATGVTIEDIRIDGAGRGNGNSRFCGIAFWNAGGAVTDCYIDAVRDEPFGGGQHGIGIYAYNDTGGPYTISVTNTPVVDFQKNGMALNGNNLTATVTGCTVIGQGPTGLNAENGIQIGWGASGTVTDCAISDIAYTGDGWAAAGLLFYQGGTVDVTGTCTMTNVMTGMIYQETDGDVDGVSFTGASVDEGEGISVRDYGALLKAGDEAHSPVPCSPLAERCTGSSTLGANTTDVDVTDCSFTGPGLAGTYGIALWALGDDVNSTVTGCTAQNWEIGIVAYESGSSVNATLNDGNLGGNVVGYWGNTPVQLDLRCLYWGDPSGPTHPMNPGGSGDPIEGPAVFWPWLTSPYPAGACDGYGTDNVAVDPASVRCLNAELPCDTVDVVFTRVNTEPARACSVTFELSPELELCDPDPSVSIREGDYFDGYGTGGMTYFSVIEQGGGVYTVDMAILGLPCGPTTSPGTLFTIDVKGSGGDGTGTITVTRVRVRDCDNDAIPALPGPPVTITIDHTPPVAIDDLEAAQWRTGNDGDGTTKIDLAFTAPGDAALVEVYRAPFGHYPEYDDGGGAVPSLPATYPPGAPWVLTGVSATGDDDQPADRDFWYYVAFSKDACGNVSDVSNMTDGTLNYHLGDVADVGGMHVGDNDVGWLDISLLNTTYWKSEGQGGYNNICDVGPTTDRSVNARPVTDNTIQFEDLMMFAINYGQVSLLAANQSTAFERPQLRLAFGEAGTEPADVLKGRLLLVGNRESTKGIHARLTLPEGLELIGTSQGELLADQGRPVFIEDRTAGDAVDVDLALLGRGQTIHGSGEVAELTFRMVGQVNELPRLVEADIRNANNRGLNQKAEPIDEENLVSDRISGEGIPARLELSATPNPSNRGTSLRLNLPRSGSVSLKVYDVSGRLVETLTDGELPAGCYSFTWQAAGVSPGVYVAMLEACGERLLHKLTVLP